MLFSVCLADLLGNRLSSQFSECLSSSHFHIIVDLSGSDVQSASEQEWEAQYIVDLVRVIRTSGCDYGILPGSVSLLGKYLRVWVRHGKYNRIMIHLFKHFLAQGTLHGHANKNIGTI